MLARDFKSKDVDKVAKKRGRPKKNMEVAENKSIINMQAYYNQKPKKKETSEEEIILFLPGMKTSNILDSEAMPNKNDIFNIDDFDIDSDSDEEKLSKAMIDKINNYEQKILKLKQKNKNYKKIIEDNKFVEKYIESFAKLIDLNLFDYSTGKQILVKQTNIVCWWDTEPFANVPCVIFAETYEDGYKVIGNFCSPSCACAYNLNMDDYKKHDRHSLTCKVYNNVCGISEIIPADKRESLTKFGGPVSIEDFRNSIIKNDAQYRFIMPPMKSICPIVECISKNILAKNDTELVVKRSKPLPQLANTFKNQFSF